MCVHVCVPCGHPCPVLCHTALWSFQGCLWGWGEDLEEADTPARGTCVSYQTPGRQPSLQPISNGALGELPDHSAVFTAD